MATKPTARRWNRLLWGVVFHVPGSRDLLIGTSWLDHTIRPYPDEPTRVLLFRTRNAARAWCDVQNAKYVGRTDQCMNWRFRVVRARETVAVCRQPLADNEKP